MFNYSFQLDLETKLRLFANQGFRFLHWCDDWNNGVLYSKEDFKLFSQLVESHGLKCQDVHGSDAPGIKIGSQDGGAFEKYVQLLRNRIEFCSAIGGRCSRRTSSEGGLGLCAVVQGHREREDTL